MGKRDVRSAAEVARERPDVVYHTFDLGDVAVRNPAFIAGLLNELSDSLESGALRPLPTKYWPIAEVVSAFRHMAQAKHTGKIVLVNEGAIPAFQSLRADGSYLITGGLGALGLATAQWMVARGAKHLVLIGRRAPDERAAAVIASLREAGAKVLVEALDVSNDGDVAQLIAKLTEKECRCAHHPWGGRTRRRRGYGADLAALYPRFVGKVRGALALARYARNGQLDFFICYSSATGVFGSPGSPRIPRRTLTSTRFAMLCAQSAYRRRVCSGRLARWRHGSATKCAELRCA